MSHACVVNTLLLISQGIPQRWLTANANAQIDLEKGLIAREAHVESSAADHWRLARGMGMLADG